jgi:hypothetical protein
MLDFFCSIFFHNVFGNVTVGHIIVDGLRLSWHIADVNNCGGNCFCLVPNVAKPALFLFFNCCVELEDFSGHGAP